MPDYYDVNITQILFQWLCENIPVVVQWEKAQRFFLVIFEKNTDLS